MVRVRFKKRAGTSPTGDTTPGNPYAAFEQSFSNLRVPGTQARTWYLGAGGTLTDQPPTGGVIDSYTSDATATPAHRLRRPHRSWRLVGQRFAVGVELAAEPGRQPGILRHRSAGPGHHRGRFGAVHLWVKSSTPDVDLQATISEVRPDGKESFVQNGWIRASERKPSTGSDNFLKRPSTLLDPIPSFTAADATPMPADQFVQVTIPLYYEGHPYRAGSRIRVTIARAQRQPTDLGVRRDRAVHGHLAGVARLDLLDALEPGPAGRP